MIVDGVLNGASTAVVTSEPPDGLNATSSDVFVTNAGDILTATGAVSSLPSQAPRMNLRKTRH